MESRKELARKAYRYAIQLRTAHNIGLQNTFDVFDLADNLGIEVKFQDFPSMEGMYVKDAKPMIIISSLRPRVRQIFTCTHEIGHHVFEHGTKIDEYLDDAPQRSKDPEEYLADQFASSLLMPQTLVCYAFNQRGWVPKNCSPHQVYTISCWLGVGYSTLSYQMKHSLNLISYTKLKELQRHTPKSIRQSLLGKNAANQLIIVDIKWKDRAIDAYGGEYILVPKGTEFEGSCAKFCEVLPNGLLFQAKSPGVARFHHKLTNWGAYLRVARKQFVGRSKFRHLEEPENE